VKEYYEKRDINDNPPEIEVASLSSSVSEDSRPGTTVALLSITDSDSGINGKIISVIDGNTPFTLSQSIQDNMFAVVTKSQLDREETSVYDITIIAKDGGEPALTSEKTISVYVSDTNDNKPEFLQNPYTFYLTENNPPGGPVLTVQATDRDDGENAHILYHLLRSAAEDNKMTSFLNINSESGEVVALKSFDFESVKTHVLLLTAFDGGKPPRSGNMTIIVNVSDVNDNPPVFSQDSYVVHLKENSPVGTTVIQVTATDLDEGSNGEVVYSFGSDVDPQTSELFHLNPETGVITVVGEIDFEESGRYEINVQASDKGAATQAAEKTVIIDILDINDNAPVIEVTSFSRALPEDSKPGTTVALISVRDSDSGINGKVLCFINQNLPFTINPSSQNNMYSLVTKQVLDREQQTQYEVMITAKDAGEPSLSSEKSITVVVSDVNDNVPTFSQNPINFYIKENNSPGKTILSVTAHDSDDGSNALISYSILREKDGDNLFTSFLNVNSESGEVVALKSFDFESVKTFQFHVVATDSGSPPLSSNVTVNVFILDQNDNAPEIPRNVNAGHLVTKVRAYDADIGYNGWLLFSLQQVTDHSLFALDRYTGQIRTLRSFTETDEAEHKLLILVKDNGNVSLSATATVIVKLVEPKEAFAASDVQSAAAEDEDSHVTFYLIITLGSVSLLFLISIIVLIAMQCSKSTDYTSKYLPEPNYDGTLCHSIQYRSGDKRYMLVGPRMSVGSTIVPGSHANTLVLPDRRKTSDEVW
uniref:Protocadherin 2 alpha a 15 n=1 Tax=Oryzias melastigma TaxID=30732 RepID=A0A3B3BB64_ORYME